MNRSEVVARIWAAYEAGEVIPACACCGRLSIDGEWLALAKEALGSVDESVSLSHSICPECLQAKEAPAPTPRVEEPSP
jgi:hypothetical protein